ncbi:unnamed protein product [Protopolystoma xenopodis]|uniref:Uncharacterized protein n=1 Tax=Protopolystoma xenopodis TaxID=117903 RepID=A0A448WAR7_9PLAT|nr:unnamed protein product [Protopolystoma xenopodis]
MARIPRRKDERIILVRAGRGGGTEKFGRVLFPLDPFCLGLAFDTRRVPVEPDSTPLECLFCFTSVWMIRPLSLRDYFSVMLERRAPKTTRSLSNTSTIEAHAKKEALAPKLDNPMAFPEIGSIVPGRQKPHVGKPDDSVALSHVLRRWIDRLFTVKEADCWSQALVEPKSTGPE